MAKVKLTDLYKSLKDKPLHEQGDIETWNSPSGEKHRIDHDKQDLSGKEIESKFNEEKVEIEIPGVEGKTEVKIKYPAEDDDRALQGVTITFSHEGDDVEQYTDIEFEADDMVEDHENEGQVWIFIAEGDGITFEVEVSVEASYQESGNIQAIDWETLTVTYDDEGEPLDEQGCTEQEIAEGTCGYAPDGEVDVNNTDKLEPAGPGLIISLQERFQKLANIKK